MLKTIYALIDPRTDDVRYVGATVDLPRRLGEHLYRCKREESHCARWLRQLLDDGHKPGVWQLAVVDGDWSPVESYWINVFRGLFDLTNIMDGGQGASAGVPKSLATRQKMSAAATRWQTGRTLPKQHKDSFSAERKKRHENSDYHEREAERMRNMASIGGHASQVARAQRKMQVV